MAALAGMSAKGTKVCEGVRGPEPLWSQHHPMLAAVELRQPGRGQATPSAPGRAFARPDLYSKGAVSLFVRRCSRFSPLSRRAQALSLCLPRSTLTPPSVILTLSGAKGKNLPRARSLHFDPFDSFHSLRALPPGPSLVAHLGRHRSSHGPASLQPLHATGPHPRARLDYRRQGINILTHVGMPRRRLAVPVKASAKAEKRLSSFFVGSYIVFRLGSG